MIPIPASRKQRGAWFTHETLISEMVGWLTARVAQRGGPLRVVDPACGDGRLLRSVQAAFPARDLTLIGCDIDAATAARATSAGLDIFTADALEHDWDFGSFDVVIGNPPFLSQLAAQTSRGGSSRFGGGPYANTAAEFAELSIRLARPDGGLVALVLPQSILGARDAESIRRSIDGNATLTWSWWESEQDYFDASVNVCMMGWERPASPSPAAPWTTVVTQRLGVPAVPAEIDSVGTVADVCTVSADFRDQYYGLVAAVDDHRHGPPLITSGLIDPGKCWWGEREVRFNKRRFRAPRVDLDALDQTMLAWAEQKLVPKVLVANQTRVIEAVCDDAGAWLPSVPVISVVPSGSVPVVDRVAPPDAASGRDVFEVAAVLSSPLASAFVWHLAGGTGLSAVSVRMAPRHLGAIPWPAGDLADAATAFAAGAFIDAGRLVLDAYRLDPDRQAPLLQWWSDRLPG